MPDPASTADVTRISRRPRSRIEYIAIRFLPELAFRSLAATSRILARLIESLGRSGHKIHETGIHFIRSLDVHGLHARRIAGRLVDGAGFRLARISRDGNLPRRRSVS